MSDEGLSASRRLPESQQSRLELGLCCNRGLLQANVLFRLGAILLFPFLFLQSLLDLPPRDDEMVVFAVAPPGT
jgi:hypothetical protein